MLLLLFVTVNLVYCYQCSEYHVHKIQSEKAKEFRKVDSPIDSFLNLTQIQQDFKEYNCMFFFNHYKRVDLKFDTFPVILRRLELTFRNQILQNLSRDSNKIWIPHGLLKGSREILHDAFPIIPCPISYFLSSINFNDKWPIANDFCIRIYLNLFASKSKPWNCLADIHFSPLKIFRIQDDVIFTQPRPFLLTKSFGLSKSHSMTASSRPSVNILIDLPNSLTNTQLLNWLHQIGFRQPSDDSSPVIIYTNIVLYTRPIKNKWTTELIETATYDANEIQKTSINIRKFIRNIEIESDHNKNTVWDIKPPYRVSINN